MSCTDESHHSFQQLVDIICTPDLSSQGVGVREIVLTRRLPASGSVRFMFLIAGGTAKGGSCWCTSSRIAAGMAADGSLSDDGSGGSGGSGGDGSDLSGAAAPQAGGIALAGGLVATLAAAVPHSWFADVAPCWISVGDSVAWQIECRTHDTHVLL